MNNPLQTLQAYLIKNSPIAVAFSGGMDSSLLALSAQRTIPGNYVALLVNSAFMSESELNIARATAEKYSINLREIRIEVLGNPSVTANSDLRCYHCKKEIFKKLFEEAGNSILCDGSVLDDEDDYRPGKKALAELGVASPLAECGFGKKEVAQALLKLGAPEVIRPAQSCLATRIVTNEEITREKLRQIEHGEIILKNAGLEFFRLRHHGEIARIEVNPEFRHDALDIIFSVSQSIKSLGFRHIVLDVEGYLKGSMNRLQT